MTIYIINPNSSRAVTDGIDHAIFVRLLGRHLQSGD